jgi:flagellar motor switch protein FliG
MKFSTKDIPHIRGLLIMTILTLILGAIAVYVSDDMLNEAQQSKTTADQEWSDAVRKLERTKNEQEDLQGYYHQYQNLVEQNIIGEEKRLDWIESIEEIRNRLNIFSVKYKLDPQETLDMVGTDLPGSSFDLRRSNMTLGLSLLHEGQLLNFIEALSEEAKGMYLLDSCVLTRNDLVRKLKFTPNLEAECTLGWITLNEKNVDSI